MAFALFCLFAVFATATQAMLLELDFRWDAANEAALKSSYKLQEGSIIQVIAFDSRDTAHIYHDAFDPDLAAQFDPYGELPTDQKFSAQPYPNGTDYPDSQNAYLVDTTQRGHDIVYTGSLQEEDGVYGLYTQITIDTTLYDTVYIRVFGATSFEPGQATASYWGITTNTTHLNPTFQFQSYKVDDLKAENKNYFEVIPEPATLGLLGLGGCALAAWRRRRSARTSGNGSAR